MGKWKIAQQEELSCWLLNSEKINHPKYLEWKRQYWQKMLARLDLSTPPWPELNALEVGCGPSGIFLLLPDNAMTTNFTILDPLLKNYRQAFPSYFNRCPEVSVPLESWSEVGTDEYDLIFAINCIDHTLDIQTFLEKLHKLVKLNGRVILAVNTHKRSWTEKVWQRFQRFLEPHHPYHFTAASYQNLFSRWFTVSQMVEIEDLIIWINQQSTKLDEATKEHSTLRHRVRGVLRYGKPANFFLGMLALFGLPAHDFDGKGNSIYAHQLFELRPKPTNVEYEHVSNNA